MLKKGMEKALNKQMNDEIRSAYLYLSMAAYFEAENLNGFAHWMRLQAQEEMGHAMKFYGFILDRGGRITLETIEAPPTTWKGPLPVFEAVFQHEKKVTASIHKLVEAARKASDYPSDVFLQWFVTEQVEEEASAEAVIDRLKMVKASPAGVFMIDREMGGRAAAAG